MDDEQKKWFTKYRKNWIFFLNSSKYAIDKKERYMNILFSREDMSFELFLYNAVDFGYILETDAERILKRYHICSKNDKIESTPINPMYDADGNIINYSSSY